MTRPTQRDVNSASMEKIATEKEVGAAFGVFEAECWRDDPLRLNRATEAAHAALQAHLDAIHSMVTVAKRSAGL